MRILGLLVAVLVLVSSQAYAQEDTLKLPPPGTTILNLSATETKKVPQDMAVASLRFEAEADDPVTIQSKINAAMQDALALAKKEADIKTTTGTYSVYPYDPNPIPYKGQQEGEAKSQRWRGQQTIDMQSLQSDVLLKLAGVLQGKGFVMNNLGYTLSPEKYESVQDELLTNALKKLQAKADLAARGLGKTGVEMLNVDLSPSGPVMPMYASAPMVQGMAMKAEMAAPVIQAGDADVSLTVSARVLLKP